MLGNSVFERYIRRYASRHFENNKAKLEAIERLCDDAISHQSNADSERLAQLLSNQHPFSSTSAVSTSTLLGSEQTASLRSLKSVQAPQRVGDIVFLPKNADVFVIGDTHGDLASTQKIIEQIRSSGAIASGAYIVFLGDYVNNGLKSWQNVSEILSFQSEHPKSVVLLNGNHEFKESYQTALNEHFTVHWDRFSAADLPESMQDRLPELDNHYGHLRLQLARYFGFEEGERIYDAFFEWGLRLPSICISGDLMISHSLGKLTGHSLTLDELLTCKHNDIDNLRRLGFEAWHKHKPSLHSALVNNRDMSAELLNEFSSVLEVNEFVVGHCHYRSADTVQFGANSITTVISSAPYSPDSGHYMYQQMMLERKTKTQEENLETTNATAGYLHYSSPKNSGSKQKISFYAIE